MDQRPKITQMPRPERRMRRISVATILALSFGALVLASVGGVMALTVTANYRNTLDLLGKSADLLVDGMDDALAAHMNRAADAVKGLSELYAQGGFELDGGAAMDSALSGALVGVPDAAAMLIYRKDGDGYLRGMAWEHPGDGKPPSVTKFERDSATLPDLHTGLARRETVAGLSWGNFTRLDGHVYASVSAPLIRNGKTQGWVVAPIDLIALSKIAHSLSKRFGTTVFIVDDKDRVIAHPLLLTQSAAASRHRPTVPLSGFDDPVLAKFPERKRIAQDSAASAPGVEFFQISYDPDKGEHFRRPLDHDYILITKTIAGYGERPWRIGAYFTKRELGEEIIRVWASAAIGFVMLLLALLAAVLIGKRIARPLRAIEAQANLLADFKLEDAKPLPRSHIREFDNQISAFNAMLTGLRAFSAYVPRSLVARLVRTGDADVTRPRESLVTVMFTDIAGFTAMSEQMPASEAVELLNQHFACICQAVDDEGGTVDKFLGDGVMAFFGAPDRLKGHAAAAVRAAIAIREALKKDNLAAAAGRPALKLRIGIHTGRVIVGDIGAADRVNYTITGDTVNVSQRLQELGKLVAPDVECAIVISGETASRVDDRMSVAESGKHRLRGRGEPVDVFVVNEGAEAHPAAESLELRG